MQREGPTQVIRFVDLLPFQDAQLLLQHFPCVFWGVGTSFHVKLDVLLIKF